MVKVALEVTHNFQLDSQGLGMKADHLGTGCFYDHFHSQRSRAFLAPPHLH